MSWGKKGKLTNGESTIKLRKETLHKLKIIKAEQDLPTISDTIDYILYEVGVAT